MRGSAEQLVHLNKNINVQVYCSVLYRLKFPSTFNKDTG